MKIRGDFVTNSSSSSFIVASNLEDDALKKKIMEVLGVPASSPIYDIAEAIAKTLVDTKESSLRDILDNWGVDNIDELPDYYADAYNGGFKVREGYASNDSWEPGEQLLCEIGIDYKDDEIIIWKEAGF